MNRARTLALPLIAALAILGCRALDVVGTTAISTFGALAEKEKGSIALDSTSTSWVLTAPGGERFAWSTDFSGTPDFRVSFDAGPYLDAGLDPAKLPPERYSFDASTVTLTLSFEVGTDSFSYPGSSPTPLETFRKIVASHRPIIGYHEALDHYGIALGEGNMFEWAKDMSRNDKDMVFVLNPAPLIASGVDPARISGWVFAKVPVKDAAGKSVEVDKFLKPYSLP